MLLGPRDDETKANLGYWFRCIPEFMATATELEDLVTEMCQPCQGSSDGGVSNRSGNVRLPRYGTVRFSNYSLHPCHCRFLSGIYRINL